MQSISQTQKKYNRQGLIVQVLLVSLMLLVLINSDNQQLSVLARYSYDFKLQQFAPNHNTTAATRIVIFSLPQSQLENPREIANLLDTLIQKGASLVAFDTVFAETQTAPLIEMPNQQFISQQQLLASKLDKYDGILGFYFLPYKDVQLGQLVMNYSILLDKPQKTPNLTPQTGYITSLPALQLAAQGTGFLDLTADADGVLRRASLLKSYQGQLFPALSLALSMTYQVRSEVDLYTHTLGEHTYIEKIKLLKRQIMTNHQAQVFIPFARNTHTLYPMINSSDLNTAKEQVLAGSVVLLTEEPNKAQQFTTPMKQTLSRTQVQATLVDNLLQGQFVSQLKLAQLSKIIAILVLAILLAIFFAKVRTWKLIALSLILVMFLYLFEVLLFIQGIQFDTSILILYVLLLGGVHLGLHKSVQIQKRQAYQRIFGQSLSTTQIQTLQYVNWHHTQAEYKPLSLLRINYPPWELFLAHLPADKQQHLQYLLLTELTEELVQHSGTLANYHYAGLSAYWGAPIELAQHAQLALACALGMYQRLPAFLQRHKIQLPQAQGLHIGLHESTFLVGDFGSKQYQSYRIKGQGTTIASHLSQLNQQYGTHILASENIYLAAPNYLFRYIDVMPIKNQFIRIYEPLCLRQHQSSNQVAELFAYEQAYKQYLQQKWYSAGVAFDKLIEQYPNSKLYPMYRQRIRSLATINVPANWRGEYPIAEL